VRPHLKILAGLSTIGMLILLLGGALVTKTESGEGCGASWPLCHGEFIPKEITMELVIEASHRLATGLVALIVVLLCFFSWKEIGHKKEVKLLSVLAIGFIILQSLIGAATVLWGQSKFFLALHFGISLISFAAVFLLTLIIFEENKKFRAEHVLIDKKLKIHTIGVTVYSLVVIYTGALVRHMNASMICPDWPFCHNNNIGLPLNEFEWVQMGHRLAAGLIFLWIFYIMITAIRKYKDQKVIYYGWIIAFVLVLLQVISGAFVVFSKVNLIISLLHALFISCLFGVLSYMLFLIPRSSKNYQLQNNQSNSIPVNH